MVIPSNVSPGLCEGIRHLASPASPPYPGSPWQIPLEVRPLMWKPGSQLHC